MTVEEAIGAGHAAPWLFELAAELADEPLDGLDDDPGVIARSLSGAVDLFSLPAVSVSFNTTVEAEAVGCTTTEGAVEGVIGTVDDAFAIDIGAVVETNSVDVRVEAIERLADTCEAAVLGGVTGPALLSEQLLIHDDAATEIREEAVFTAGEICVELVNTYLDAGADGVAVLEPNGLDVPLYGEAAEPIINTLDHYEAEGTVVTDTAAPQDVRTAATVGFDAITGAVDDERVIQAAQDRDIAFGVGVPREAFKSGPDAVAAFRDELPADVGLSSQWTVPQGTPPEAIHELMDSL
jgi:uroporphyrinogen-III decarboxylase